MLTPLEMSDPLDPAHMASNNVLEDEIAAAAVAAGADPVAAARRMGLELKLRCLEGAVAGGELTLRDYCNMVAERAARDRVLALWLMRGGRAAEAKRVARRVRLMEDELAGVPEEERG
ncbi:hypothetical protein JKP88DRAFT_231435 [Tribonema minus]|uniref:Uncharacterized protein n=1 Tax=Tribonema minus TaxID=303371 RepID=A0A835ZDR7_9STRA|nr:hypothetical protein JKP88DRAFT_231435 [Tribonema minus]